MLNGSMEGESPKSRSKSLRESNPHPLQISRKAIKNIHTASIHRSRFLNRKGMVHNQNQKGEPSQTTERLRCERWRRESCKNCLYQTWNKFLDLVNVGLESSLNWCMSMTCFHFDCCREVKERARTPPLSLIT